MRLDEIRKVKIEVNEILNKTAQEEPAVLFSRNSRLTGKDSVISPGLGIYSTGKETCKLAIRLTYESDWNYLQPVLKPILKKLSPEDIDLQVTGPIIPFLSIGSPIAQHSALIWDISYGTLGCFVQKRSCPGDVFILSNSHVLVSRKLLNNIGDVIEQNLLEKNSPIISCKNLFSRILIDRIASLEHFAHPKSGIDAAIARVKDVDRIRANSMREVQLKGIYRNENLASLLTGVNLFKVGARTNRTCGRITSFEHTLNITYGNIKCEFSKVLEIKQDKESESAIEGQAIKVFSKRGDSGSVVFDPRNNYAVALIFSGSASEDGTTYAIPISTVFDALDIELAAIE